uniref:Uncharacterized protein n=1 Tax=Arundo donax TaxID=35708 RepID=A0A0A9C6P8_ARUDO
MYKRSVSSNNTPMYKRSVSSNYFCFANPSNCVYLRSKNSRESSWHRPLNAQLAVNLVQV